MLGIQLTAEADLPPFSLTLTGPLDRPQRTLDATALIGRLVEQRATGNNRRKAAEAGSLPPNTIIVPTQPAPAR